VLRLVSSAYVPSPLPRQVQRSLFARLSRVTVAKVFYRSDFRRARKSAVGVNRTHTLTFVSWRNSAP
jgi:hypothetical protein